MNRICAVFLTAALAAGCSTQPQSAALGTTETPVAGARAVAPIVNTPPQEAVPGPAVYNSENKPVISRSGLNSDPNNPSGMPGRPTAPSGG